MIRRSVVLVALLFGSAGSHALLEDVSYEATRVMRVDGYEIVTRVHHAPRMERITASLIGMEVTVIMRTDRNLAWQLIPLMGVYGESDLSAMDTPENIRILSREPVGVETIRGIAVTKFRARFVTQGGTHHEGFYWQNADGVHVRTEFPFIGRDGGEKRIELELRDVELGPQPAYLFELPEGYSKVDLDIASLLPI